MIDKILESACEKRDWIAVLARLNEISVSQADLENTYGVSGQCLLHLLAKNGQLEAVEFLLNLQDINVDVPDNIKRTPLHLAVEHRHLDVIKALVGHGANVNAVDRKGHTPIHVFNDGKNRRSIILTAVTDCICGQDDPEAIIQFLSEHGADVDFKNRNGSTILHTAAESGRVALTRVLVASGANVDTQDNRGNTAMHIAVAEFGAQTIPVLLQGNANCQIPNQKGATSSVLLQSNAGLTHGIALQAVTSKLDNGCDKGIRPASQRANELMRRASTTAMPVAPTNNVVNTDVVQEPAAVGCGQAFVQRICKMAWSRYD